MGLKSLLDTHHFDDQYLTSDNIDVVLVETTDKAAMAIRNNIELGLELKHTKNTGEHERQVILQHVATSYLNYDYPMLILMSDFSTRFTFYWFGKSQKIIWKYKASIAEAMYLLDHMFVNHNVMRENSDKKETFPKDFLIGDHGTWDSFNPINMGTIHEKENEEGYGNDNDRPSDANHQKEKEDIPENKKIIPGILLARKNRCTKACLVVVKDALVTITNLEAVLGFNTFEEHEKEEAVLEYVACNVLSNVVLT